MYVRNVGFQHSSFIFLTRHLRHTYHVTVVFPYMNCGRANVAPSQGLESPYVALPQIGGVVHIGRCLRQWISHNRGLSHILVTFRLLIRNTEEKEHEFDVNVRKGQPMSSICFDKLE